MSIDSIKSTISSLPKSAQNTVKSVGASTLSASKKMGQFVSDKTPQTLKNLKMPKQIDTFVKTAKDKTPEFVKEGGSYIKNHKEAIVGGGIIAAAVACAAALVKTVSGAIAQAKEGQKIGMHQG